MFDIRTLLLLITALPLGGAVITAAMGPRWLRNHSHWPAVLSVTSAFLLSIPLAWQVYQLGSNSKEAGWEQTYTLWTWADVQNAYRPASSVAAGAEAPLTTARGPRDFEIAVTLRADSLTAVMLVMVTLVSALVIVYSIGYMHGDPGYWRFFAYVSLFVFSMTMLVSVSNFLLLYIFWEAVGVCSYLLIGFWYQKPEAAAAGKKAFLVNRVGDFGFALAVFLIWTTYGTLSFHDNEGVAGVLGQQRLSGQLGFAGGGVGLAICLLLLLGACGKSAQWPLHVWLPDAMEGPTPVSALIHAATMVTAGVYMVARCSPLFFASPDAQLIVSVIGGATALLAATIALTQFDLKRVLAYSTISQLGYMFLALGTGTLAGITAGMFHLFTHAFFKALLFLGAGSVMHAMGNVMDMRRFGGLRSKLPVTHATFAIGCLALAGIFPFAGFWSKDAVISSVHDKAEEIGHSIGGHSADGEAAVPSGESPLLYVSQENARRTYLLLYYAALLTALLTAIYTFRAFFLTFYGPEKLPEEADSHAHESPRTMWIPLVILAVFAAVVGALLEPTAWFAHILQNTPVLAFEALIATSKPHTFHVSVALASTAMALLGLGLAAYLYLGSRRRMEWPRDTLGSQRLGTLLRLPWHLSARKFYFDELYQFLFVSPLRFVARLSFAIDNWLIDGSVDALARVPAWLGTIARKLQNGLVPFYGLAMALAVMLTLIIAQVLFSGGSSP